MQTIKLLLTILAGILLLFSCKTKSNEQAAKEVEVLPENIVELSAEQFKVAGIEFGLIGQKNLSNTIKANGLIIVSPQNLASVCAPMGGFVKATDLVQGSPVKKGQTLAIMENPEFIELQQNYLEAKSKLEYAEAEYRRHQELYQEDVYSAKNFQEVTANYKSLKTQLNALGQKLSLIGIDASQLKDETITRTTAVTSPIDGYVRSVNVNIGKFVSPTDIMFEIINTSSLTVELTLFEQDINKVSTGQKIRFALPNEESQQYEAQITQFGKSIASDKTVKVFAMVKQASSRILPGMYVNAWIETTVNPVSALPSESIIQFDEKYYIFIFHKNKEEAGKPFTEFKMIEVKRGVTDAGFTEVILPDGLDINNTKVVIKGAYNLMAAMKNAGEMAC